MISRASAVPYAVALMCAALGLVPVANMIKANAVPWWPAAVTGWILHGGALLIVAGLLSLLGTRVDRAVEGARSLLLRVPAGTFGLMAAFLVTAAAATLSIWCFAGQPFTTDEMAQQWHARILLSGRLAATPEAHPEFFNTAPVFDRDGRWFSQYPIGGPAWVALGALANAEWLVNPLLLGVATWWLYQFFRRVGSEALARVAVVLFVTSPMVIIMAASQMNHVPALAAAALALLAVARWEAAVGPSRHLHAALAGLGIGFVALVRPLDAVLLAVVIGTFQLWRAAADASRWSSLATQAVAGAVPIVALLVANDATTGRALLFGYEALNGPEHALGFHADPNGDMHTPLRGVGLASGYLMRLGRYLFEWPLPGTLFVVAGLLFAPRSRWTNVLAAVVAAFLIGYGAYWFDGFFSGPRFLFTAMPAFVYFAALSVGAFARLPRARIRNALLLVIPLSLAASWLGVTGESSALGRARSYREQRTKLKTDIEDQIRSAGLSNALVFVNEGWRGNLLARLRVHGVSQFRADRIVSTLDACALQTALDDEPAGPDRADRIIRRAQAYGVARPEPGLPADRAIALVPGTRPTPVCLREFFRDTSGTMPYPMFLARQEVTADGRPGGDVVFARDLGDRNDLLRERFGDRKWYRYVPGRDLSDDRPAFVPYARPGP